MCEETKEEEEERAKEEKEKRRRKEEDEGERREVWWVKIRGRIKDEENEWEQEEETGMSRDEKKKREKKEKKNRAHSWIRHALPPSRMSVPFLSKTWIFFFSQSTREKTNCWMTRTKRRTMKQNNEKERKEKINVKHRWQQTTNAKIKTLTSS
jgi:hypothetical protein